MPQTFPNTLLYNLPKTGCDSHAHLIYPNIQEDLEEILERAYATGLSHIGQIFLSVERYYETKHLFDKHPNVFFTIGTHPNDISKKYTDNTIDEFRKIFKEDSRMKAVGEIGLDFYIENDSPEIQEKAFREQLALAKELDLPVVIHSREAFDATLAVLDDMDFANYPLVWHCFCGNKAQIDELNKRGWYISVPGAITYPANKEARADIIHIPADKLMIETDCPFLSPQGWRGQRNEPALVSLTAKVIAECRNVPLDDLWTQCGDNARRLFRIEK